ncbi:MAG TPA: hypothetical protein PKV93_14170 [Fervidobacterium sp.]|nr:hypothetical protein [Fervidobacterium sp.]
MFFAMLVGPSKVRMYSQDKEYELHGDVFISHAEEPEFKVHNDIDVIRLDSLHPDFDVLCSYFFIATDDKNNALYISFDYGLTQSHKSTFVARTSKYFETNDAIWIVQGQDIIILDKATGKMEKKQIDILTAEEIIELSKREGDYCDIPR